MPDQSADDQHASKTPTPFIPPPDAILCLITSPALRPRRLFNPTPLSGLERRSFVPRSVLFSNWPRRASPAATAESSKRWDAAPESLRLGGEAVWRRSAGRTGPGSRRERRVNDSAQAEIHKRGKMDHSVLMRS